MLLSEKLQKLRKSKGYSQEELSNLIGVSRQAISKWESGQSCPDISNLITLSDIYSVSIDSILKDGDSADEAGKSTDSNTTSQVVNVIDVNSLVRYEYKSKITLLGLPLVHIKFSRIPSKPAKGIIAIGDSAIGLFAFGGAAVGLISIGGLALGGLSLGGLAVGAISLGGLSIGSHVALGGCAISNFISMGGYAASNHVAIGGLADSVVALSGNNDIYKSLIVNGESISCTKEAFMNAAQRELPSPFWRPTLNMISNFLSNHARFNL